jgi:non-ribosomal peptide synthetase component F
MDYSASLMTESQGLDVFDTLLQALDCFIEVPNQRLEEVDLLGNRNWVKILELTQTTPHYTIEATCLHEAIEKQVRCQPSALAVVSEVGTLTYEELNDMANRLSHHLIDHSAGPEVVIAFYFQKSL